MPGTRQPMFFRGSNEGKVATRFSSSAVEWRHCDDNAASANPTLEPYWLLRLHAHAPTHTCGRTRAKIESRRADKTSALEAVAEANG
ncbi:unnamed protein product [Taenia asiatica]|uniref:Uncharacterized protein n=1 Tax=Taenia asiatica TaxID=60517 RepID=A0A0R3WBH5_TAEAS|nr:unnamed protein product [Taenia asiatica]